MMSYRVRHYENSSRNTPSALPTTLLPVLSMPSFAHWAPACTELRLDENEPWSAIGLHVGMVAACPSQEELQFCLAAAQQPRPSSSSAATSSRGFAGGGSAPCVARVHDERVPLDIHDNPSLGTHELWLFHAAISPPLCGCLRDQNLTACPASFTHHHFKRHSLRAAHATFLRRNVRRSPSPEQDVPACQPGSPPLSLLRPTFP